MFCSPCFVFFNIDAEYTHYKIQSGTGKHTNREIHFGIQHNSVSANENDILLRVRLTMNENQYAAIIEFIDQAIKWYENGIEKLEIS